MNKFKIVPLNEDYATQIRETKKDAFNMKLLHRLQPKKGHAEFH